MEITWDDNKARINFKKHGITFEEASSVLTSTSAITYEDTKSSEQRYVTIGFSVLARLLVVVTCYRDENKLRIISARKANKKERELYEKTVRI